MTARVEHGPAAAARAMSDPRAGRARGLWRDGWYRLTRNRAAVVSLTAKVCISLPRCTSTRLEIRPLPSHLSGSKRDQEAS